MVRVYLGSKASVCDTLGGEVRRTLLCEAWLKAVFGKFCVDVLRARCLFWNWRERVENAGVVCDGVCLFVSRACGAVMEGVACVFFVLRFSHELCAAHVQVLVKG